MAAPERTIRLHPAQQEFLRSDAIFRAFAGGIGSGKSWAGAYDLIRRAKPGRLYMVMAPTYSMLADATFRMFEGLARELGIVDGSEVKRSPPPSIRLRTGAEVLFRSADEPDRLRGPNLSGVWLDEASLMAEEAFTIAIGRLREAGEQGWLTATFTPKGKQHWTFETFATGRPNTAIFHARTADNPFLPPNFESTVRQQYTSTLADQELEGLFLDQLGTMFRREWFAGRIVYAGPAEMGGRIRYWDKAGTADGGAFTCGVRIDKDAGGLYYVVDVVRGQWSSHDRNRIMLATAHQDGPGVTIWVEQEPGSGGKESAEITLRELAGFDVHAERPTGDKATRAVPYAAQCEAGNVRLVRGPWVSAYIDELTGFPLGRYKDQADASSGAFNKLALTFTGGFKPTDDPRARTVVADAPPGVFLS
jgi:predicted phage terminase large subunit-like protein